MQVEPTFFLAIDALTLQLLDWIAARPRTYGETMEAWRTSCPRMPVWEDALSDGLVGVARCEGVGMNSAQVTITALGRAVLTGQS
ncbi:MAG TPA: hypothetical protein VGI79_11885 [Caulobacteraceae bacterium]